MKMKPATTVQRNISLSRAVAEWAEDLASRKGHGSNFSGYIADLIRRDKEKQDESNLAAKGKQLEPAAEMMEAVYDQIINTVQAVAKEVRHRKKKS